jgi:broad specificity phosphatase PhoE
MKELNLILVRHGETDYNVPPRKFQGQFGKNNNHNM